MPRERARHSALLVRESTIREPVSGKDYEALVAAKSRALATLSQEIAGGIGKLRPSSP